VAGIVAGDADDPLVAHQAAGLGVGGVTLPDVHAVAVEFGGKVRPVVEDKGGAALLHDRPQDAHGVADRRVIGVLEAQLHGGDIAGIKRGGELQ